MVNKCILIGNTCAETKVTELGDGVQVAKVRLATNENYKNKNGEWESKAEFHDIIFWRQQAQRAAKLQKGDTVYIEGKLTTRKWEDINQITRYTTEVIANYFRVINKRNPQAAADDGPDWLKD